MIFVHHSCLFLSYSFFLSLSPLLSLPPTLSLSPFSSASLLPYLPPFVSFPLHLSLSPILPLSTLSSFSLFIFFSLQIFPDSRTLPGGGKYSLVSSFNCFSLRRSGAKILVNNPLSYYRRWQRTIMNIKRALALYSYEPK